nr:uncharacterized protein LOC121132258 [Lepeophtheirus salmonis]
MSPGLEMTPVYEEMVAGDAGKLGCIKPFHHIEGIQNVEVDILCNRSSESEHGVLVNFPHPSPKCVPIPCTCLGDSSLTPEEALNIIENACHNLDNVRMFERDQFVIPKRDICGSFNTQSPNKENQCSCTKVEISSLWQQYNLTALEWKDSLGNISSLEYISAKNLIENSLNNLFFKWNMNISLHYIRSVLIHLEPLDNDEVQILIIHQFKKSSIDSKALTESINQLLESIGGKIPNQTIVFNSKSQLMEPPVCLYSHLIQQIPSNLSLKPFNEPKQVYFSGERVDLVCHNDSQTLKGPDLYWDSNSTDGRISLVCRTNGEFQSLPNRSYSCVATCSMDVPMPSNESGLYLKDRKPDVVFEGELIRFECQNSSLALQIFDGSGEIDSNKDLISIQCGPDGRYNITKKKNHDEFDFPTCLPRAKKCTCLGDIEDLHTAMSILEKYVYGTPGHISKDTTIDSITKYVHEVITPTKNRKGTIDLQNVTKENECTCRTYQNQGTRNSIWFSVEILNLPWKDEYLRLKDKKTIFAKGLLDKMVNEYLYSLPELRNAGYVRSEIFQFLRGSVDLIEKRKGLDSTRRSVIHSDLRIISNLNNQEEIGTRVWMEFQFMNMTVVIFKSILENEIKDDLFGPKIWIEGDCLEKEKCVIESIKRCNNDVLGSLAGLGFNHDNYITGSRKLASGVQVGSTVNLICNNPFQIIAEDVLDHDPTDNKITIECLINGKFNFPNMKDLPECKAYCEDKRHPAPPTYSGLVINQKHLNKTKYWKDDYISYLCKDQKLGVNGADESKYRFYCLTTDSHVAAQFHFPNMKKNETWPICETKTTTVPPVIIKAIDNAKKNITGDLIRQITADQYYHEKYSEDPNYLSSITIPFFFCPLLIFIGILYILRLDHPFLKLKSDS